MAWLSETAMAAKLIEWLQAQGWSTFEEITFRGRSARMRRLGMYLRVHLGPRGIIDDPLLLQYMELVGIDPQETARDWQDNILEDT